MPKPATVCSFTSVKTRIFTEAMDEILKLETASLTVDFSNSFLIINWLGRVDFEDYKTVLLKASDIADVHNIQNVIINRLNLRELNTESRVWMKNHFLKKVVRPLIPKLAKVATIESRSPIGQVYSKTISKTVSLVYPNLSFKSFGSEIEAYQWFQGDGMLAKLQSTEHADEHLEEKRSTLIDSIYQLYFSLG